MSLEVSVFPAPLSPVICVFVVVCMMLCVCVCVSCFAASDFTKGNVPGLPGLPHLVAFGGTHHMPRCTRAG